MVRVEVKILRASVDPDPFGNRSAEARVVWDLNAHGAKLGDAASATRALAENVALALAPSAGAAPGVGVCGAGFGPPPSPSARCRRRMVKCSIACEFCECVLCGACQAQAGPQQAYRQPASRPPGPGHLGPGHSR